MKLVVAALGALAILSGAARAEERLDVVELYQSQGCSSCPPTNANVIALADRPDVLALSFGVTYWDYLGWKDTFAQPEFTDRQRAYDKKLGVRDVYTPQVIVDGRAQASGARLDAVQRLIRDARHDPADPPQMKLLPGGRVAVGSARLAKGGAEVWLIRYDPREQTVEITAGDNRGQTVSHRNVVRQAVLLGPWKGRPVVFRAPPPTEEGLESVVLVQLKGGRILGVLKAPTP